MAIELALYQPDIAQNTGTLLRLGACLDARIHIIHPTGFTFSKAALKRSGMDYLDHADFVEHVNFARFHEWCRAAERRLVLLTTKAEQSAYELAYTERDVLMVGRESAGVPDDVAEKAAQKIRIPMREGLRSINVALAATLILGEAKRQTKGFDHLK
jgi:tRNA (cytidine/uridine-2'-O-)-methyltransferase